jgi:HlyD family secretion protein
MKYAVLVVILVVTIGGYLAYSRAKTANAAAANVPDTRLVVRRDLEKLISANGKIASNRDVDIKCQASGKIIKLPFDISDHVKGGDLLMELDPVDQQRSVDQAEAQVSASRARLAQTKTNYDVAVLNVETSQLRAQADLDMAKVKANDAANKLKRTQELFDGKLASPEALENANTVKSQANASVQLAEAALKEVEQQRKSLETKKQDIATAEAQLKQDQARLDLQNLQLQYTKVYVPDDDLSKTANYRVSKLPVQVGAVVQSGASGFSGGTTVMTLSDLSHLFVLASVDESDIGHVLDPQYSPVRQKVHITVDSYPNEQFEGEVVRVASIGVNTSNVVTFEVKIEITSDNKQKLRPEMTATVKIVQESRPNALVIPAAAFVKPLPPEDDQAVKTVSSSASAPASAPASAAPASQPATTRAARGGGSRSGRGRPTTADSDKVVPQDGTVTVMENGVAQSRDVTVGLIADDTCEVLKGLQEGDEVLLNKNTSDSRWRGQNNPNMRGIPRAGR